MPFFTTVRFWFFRESHSLLSTIYELGQANEWFLCVVVGVFSVVFPAAKLAALFRAATHSDPAHASESLALVENLGKWSMLDVFVLAIFIVVIKMGSVITASLAPGAYCFVLSVVLAMASTMLIRRRLREKAEDPVPAQEAG